MKKNIALILAIITMLAFTGCLSTGGTTQQTTTQATTTVQETDSTSTVPTESEQPGESPLFEIIDQIYAIKSLEFALGDNPVDLTNKDSVKYFTGLDDVTKIKDAAASEPLMSAQAYSLVLIQLNNAADAESVAEAILNGVDPIKWICVGADDVQVVSSGDLIMLIMVSTSMKDTVTSQQIVDIFKQIRGGTLDVQLKK